MQMSVILASTRAPSATDDGPLEFECRSIHLHVEKGQQARTDGVLSGDGHVPGYQLLRLTPQYQAGMGTRTSSHAPGFINAITRRCSNALDRAIAWSLPLHTQGACMSVPFVHSNGPTPSPSWIRIFDAKLYVIAALFHNPAVNV